MDRARLGRCGKAKRGVTGQVGFGWGRHGQDCRDRDGQGLARLAWTGVFGLGEAGKGTAWQVRQGAEGLA